MDTLPEGDIRAEHYPHCSRCSQKPKIVQNLASDISCFSICTYVQVLYGVCGCVSEVNKCLFILATLVLHSYN